MNFPLMLAVLLALTAPAVAPVVAPGDVAPTTTSAAAVADDGVVHAASEAGDGTGVQLAEVDLTVPAIDEVAPADDTGAVPDVVAPDGGQAPQDTPTDAAGPSDEAPSLLEAEAEVESHAPVRPTPGTTVVADELTGGGLLETAPVDTAGYQTVGVTWPVGADAAGLDARVRTSAGGEWGEWVPLDAGDGPDPGTADAAAELRGGTDPLWIGDADAVQLAFAATETGGPEGLSLALVGSDLDTASATAATVTTAATDATVHAASTSDAAFVTAATQAAAPRVVTRAQWGAPAPTCRVGVAAKLVGAVLHHTAGSNAYTSAAQAMQQIRNDASYHMKTRGWCDIGYNFIVDKWGNIYEGRAGSMTKPVIGVHAGGFNTGTLGVSMLGTYTAAPGAATQRAVASIIGWRLGAYGVDPRGTMTYWTGAGQNSKYSSESVRLPRVFGHREVAYTACPGNGGMAALPAIRTMAADAGSGERYEQARAVVEALYRDLLGRGVDPSGLATWTAQLVGGASQAELVLMLTRSDEYIRLRTTEAYRTVLGRAPEPAGAAHWLSQIRAGEATVDDVQRQFFDSDEFRIRAGGTGESYVAAVYQAALGRAATAGELAAQVHQLHAKGRTGFLDDVWFSTDAAAHRAGAYYQVFLKRTPDAAGRAHWAQVLLTQSEGAVRTGIAGSTEYRQRAVARYS